MKKFFMSVVAVLCMVSLTAAQTAAIAQNPTPDPATSSNPNQTSPTPQPQPSTQTNAAQSATSASSTARNNEIPNGTEIKATLDQRLSTDTSKVGDRFSATVAEPVRSADGNVVIPQGAKVQGEVTEVEQGKTVAALRGKAKLNFRFTGVQLPSGQAVPIQATLVSVNSTNSGSKASTSNEGEVSGGNTGTRTARDVGIGAGVGTLAGLIFGSALKGLAIGAIAGGGYVLATSGKKVDLPQQTGLVLRVDQNVPVSSQP